MYHSSYKPILQKTIQLEFDKKHINSDFQSRVSSIAQGAACANLSSLAPSFWFIPVVSLHSLQGGPSSNLPADPSLHWAQDVSSFIYFIFIV